METLDCQKWLPEDFTAGKQYLEENSTKDPDSDCRLWDLKKQEAGYGVGTFLGYRMYAHQLSWIVFNQKNIPEKHEILHDPLNCRFRHCVEATHLRAGTKIENAQDKVIAGTLLKGEKHWNWNSSWTTEQRMEVKRIVWESPEKTEKQIAEETKTSIHLVQLARKELPNRKRKKQNHITVEEVIEIRKEYKEGKSKTEIAEKFRCSQSTVSDLISGKIRKEVQETVEATRDFDLLTRQNKLKKRTITDKMGCWVFQGSTDHGGYGKISQKGKNYKAHVLSWILFKNQGNPVPPKMMICHDCPVKPSNRLCGNPEHLKLGTAKDNGQDQVRDGTCNSKHSMELKKEILKKLTEKTAREVAEEYEGINIRTN